jgi:hypothetical protein
MQATRFSVPACLCLFASVLVLSCGGDEATTQPHPACGACGGETAAAGADSAGFPSFTPGGSGGSTATPVGGESAIAGTSGDAGSGTAGSTTGGAAGASMGGALAGDGGTATNSDGEQLELCVRLSQAAVHSTAVARAYPTSVYFDCRVHWVVALGTADLATFKNDLLSFNYAFWGCTGTPPVDTFALVFGTPPLSQGDVEALIDLYLADAHAELDLSPLESEQMRAALERLAKPLVTDPSFEPSKSECSAGAGGAGAGGAPAGAAGVAPVGGAASSWGGAP